MKKLIELDYLEVDGADKVLLPANYPSNGMFIVNDGTYLSMANVRNKNGENAGYVDITPIPASYKILDSENSIQIKEEVPKRNGVGEWVSGKTLKEIIQILIDKKS